MLVLAAALAAPIGVAQNAKPCRFSIVEFGAVGDGPSFSTLAVQKAIDTVEADGGGTVVIPEGVFTTGARVQSTLDGPRTMGFRRGC